MKKLDYPFTLAETRELRVGDRVCLSGKIFTGRDRLHRHLFDGGKCPAVLKNGALYHCGPILLGKEGAWKVTAAGPTTSMREEPYMSRIIATHHVRIIIGKGGMGEQTRKACAEHGCVYVQAVGGAAALIAEHVESVCAGHFVKEFGPTDALWELIVKDFPGVVTMDTRGRSLHKRVETASKKALKELLA